MSHQFSFTHTVNGVTADEFKSLLASEEFHVGLAKQLHGDLLEVLALQIDKASVQFKRKHPLNAKLPSALQKLVQGGLAVVRTDSWDIQTLICESSFELNAPVRMSMTLKVEPAEDAFRMHHEWRVSVNIPLVGKVIAQTLEKDIRKEAQAELIHFEAHCVAMLSK